MTSELRPAVEVWKEAHSAYCGPYDRNGWYTEAAVAVIEADREAVRAEQAAELAKFKALAETLAEVLEEIQNLHYGTEAYSQVVARIALRKWKEARDD